MNTFYKTVTVHRCMQSKVPKYLTDCCTPVSDIASQRHLRSASRHHLSVPRHRLSTFGHRVFSVAGPTVWNSLTDSLRDPALSSSNFGQLLKTDCFNTQRIRDAVMTAVYKYTNDTDIGTLLTHLMTSRTGR